MKILIQSRELDALLPMKMFGEKIGENSTLYQLALLVESTCNEYAIIDDLKSELKIYVDQEERGLYQISMCIGRRYSNQLIEPVHLNNKDIVKHEIRNAFNNVLTVQKEK